MLLTRAAGPDQAVTAQVELADQGAEAGIRAVQARMPVGRAPARRGHAWRRFRDRQAQRRTDLGLACCRAGQDRGHMDQLPAGVLARSLQQRRHLQGAAWDTGMCRLIAADGAWQLPALLTTIKPTR